jgi:hypothetical protein
MPTIDLPEPATFMPPQDGSGEARAGHLTRRCYFGQPDDDMRATVAPIAVTFSQPPGGGAKGGSVALF